MSQPSGSMVTIAGMPGCYGHFVQDAGRCETCNCNYECWERTEDDRITFEKYGVHL